MSRIKNTSIAIMHASAIRPIFRTLRQSSPHRILADILPFLRVIFAVAQPVMKTASLKFTKNLVGRCCRAALTSKIFRQPVFPAEQVERLRAAGGLKCSQKVADLLAEISPKTIDRLLARERSVRCLKQHRRPPVHPLLCQRVPVKR